MPDDEPLEDLRAVGMTAGAAAARVVETLVRDAQNKAREQQHPPYTGEQLNQLQAWARSNAQEYVRQHPPTAGAPGETSPGETSPGAGTSRDRPTTHPATQPTTGTAPVPGYDSPERRAATAQAMTATGMPAEELHARTTADLMNGTNPLLAARSGATPTTRPARTGPAPERQHGR